MYVRERSDAAAKPGQDIESTGKRSFGWVFFDEEEKRAELESSALKVLR
jgi:hypothetical protein